MRTPESVLVDTLAAAEKMCAHLERSYHQAGQSLPLRPEAVSQLDNQAIDRLDLYLSRFGKLQDFMVNKLFRALARASMEDTGQDVSVLDTLNRMAKFGVIEDVDAWMSARLLRNAFAHEYLTDDAAIAENINGAYQLFALLQDTLKRSTAFYREHIATPS